MSFLSVMKAFASGTASVVTAAPVIEGVTQVVAPQAVPLEQQLVGIIGTVERSFAVAGQSGNGALKAQAALPLVTEALKTSNLVAGKTIADPDQFSKAAQLYIDATVALLNSLQHPAATVPQPQTAAVAA